MKGIFKALSMVILVAALIGAGVLVKKNQETRRGAASTDSSSSVLPNTVSSSPGASFSTFVWLNTGKDTDKLQGAEVSMSFDASKLNLTGFEPQSGYSVLDENLAFDSINKVGKFNFAMVSLGTEKGGAVSLAKLTFKAIGSGSGSIVVTGSKIMVNGQSSSWNVTKNGSSSISISGSQPTAVVGTLCGWCGTSCVETKPNMMCTKIAPPAGKSCVSMNGKCTIVDTSRDRPCSSDANCLSGEYCYQPPMPVCKPGMACIEVMPSRVCRPKKVVSEGEMCGGIRGAICAAGLRCEYGLMPEKLPQTIEGSSSMIADGSGVCVKDTVYCDANGKCPTGFSCVKPGPCPLDPKTGMPTACAFRAYCKKLPVTPTPIVKCTWCGTSCGVVNTNQVCPMIAPPAGKSCVNVNGKCTIVPSVTPTPWAACGQRCTQNQQCQGGMTCAPIWWPCGPMPATAMNKVQSDQGLTKEEVADMIRICPTVKGVMPSGYETMNVVKMPSFYGVCRNPKCISSTNCSCAPTPTPNGKLKSDLFIWEKLEKDGVFALGENAKVGVQFNVPPQNGYSTAPGRVSVINARVTFDKNMLEATDVTIDNPSFNNIMKKEVDNGKGLIWLYVGSSKPYTDLSAGISLATITFKTKAEGKALVGISKSFPIEMSGVDNNSKTVSYDVMVGQDKFVTIGQTGTCQVCNSGATKKSGDANCDGLINSIDFEIWRSEMFDQGGLSGTVKSTWQSDYNCDQKVSGVDFEIWRKTVFQ